MINPYFLLISAVRMGSRLTGVKLYDNYAFHGALRRFANLNIGEIVETEGIEDVPEKAESFIFGQKCGRVIEEYISGYETEIIYQCEALLANRLLMKLTPWDMMKYSSEELEKNITQIFRALIKRAQIRTHTAKPGGEDIHAWLADYYRLQKDYGEGLPVLVRAIINPDEKLTAGFFSKKDPIIALALMEGDPTPEELSSAMEGEPETVFGRILRDIAFHSNYL